MSWPPISTAPTRSTRPASLRNERRMERVYYQPSVQPLVLLAVLGSAFLHALWNAIVKREPDPEVAGAGAFAVGAVAGVVVALAAGAPFAPGAEYAVAAGLFETGYIVTLSRALALAPLGPVYTVSR